MIKTNQLFEIIYDTCPYNNSKRGRSHSYSLIRKYDYNFCLYIYHHPRIINYIYKHILQFITYQVYLKVGKNTFDAMSDVKREKKRVDFPSEKGIISINSF